ncbi:MAG: AraC family transcriptional regulator ligand-binding domain-containing protein [Dinoroseobacter sp.]|nr:AraC family transcriptional regulator ligand-binding domain-containing protein [Dinoroseobacter sp.]
MGWISVVFVHKALAAALAGKQDSASLRATLFRMVDVDPDATIDPAEMVSADDFFGLLERIAQDIEGGRNIPITMGASMRCDDYGAFGLAFKSAPDLHGSYTRVERFGTVVTSIANFRVEEKQDGLSMEVIQSPAARLGLTMANELALAAAMTLSREVSSETVVPRAVHLMASKPDDETVYKAHFGCPIHFQSDRDALELDLETARCPNRLADTGMSSFFEAHLGRELDTISDDPVLAGRVLDQIGNALSEGVPTLAEVAEGLGMSSRTLQRRLSDDGLAYQDLVGEARRTLSEQLLRRTDYALAEIAFLTGFSDQSTFTRAFKRWHGRTPANYRRGD